MIIQQHDHYGGKALTYLTEKQDRANDLAAIFLDLRLPTIRGVKLLEENQVKRADSHLLLIVMTSQNSPERIWKDIRSLVFPAMFKRHLPFVFCKCLRGHFPRTALRGTARGNGFQCRLARFLPRFLYCPNHLRWPFQPGCEVWQEPSHIQTPKAVTVPTF